MQKPNTQSILCTSVYDDSPSISSLILTELLKFNLTQLYRISTIGCK